MTQFRRVADVTRNIVSGTAGGAVVQARDIYLGGHSDTSLPVPRQLPTDVRGFTGRADDLERLDRLLADLRGREAGESTAQAVVISAIDGMAGVGKTALAVRWAHRVREQFPDGQLYVNLRGFDPSGKPADPEAVLADLLRMLDVPAAKIPRSLDAKEALYRSMLAGRRMLVLLDNARTADQVTPLLPGSATCMVVVTSRNRLSGLVVHQGAHRITLGLLTMDESVSLLRQIIGPERADPASLERLATLCVQLPLALQIAGERVANEPAPLAELVTELADEQSRLDALTADGDAETTAVRAVFSWSYRALPAAPARLFRLLGLIPGPDITVPAAAALAGTTVREARESLRFLVGAHMLQAHEQRYRFHDLLRVYAAEQAARDEPVEDRMAARRRLVDWYVRTADNALTVTVPERRRVRLGPPSGDVTPITFDGHAQAMDWYEAEQANLVAAARRAGDHELSGIAWAIPVVVSRFFFNRPWDDWIKAHKVCLTVTRNLGNSYGEAELLTSLGIAFYKLRRIRESLRCHKLALAIRRAIGDRYGESQSLNNLGFPYKYLRHPELAYVCFQLAHKIAVELVDRDRRLLSLINLGNVSITLRNWDAALGWSRQALVIAREVGRRTLECDALLFCGMAYRELGQTDEALACHQEALTLSRELEHSTSQGMVLNELGRTLLRSGALAEAVDCHEEALRIHCKLGDRYREATSLDYLARDLLEGQDREQARRHWQAALAIFEALRAPEADEVRARLHDLGDDPPAPDLGEP